MHRIVFLKNIALTWKFWNNPLDMNTSSEREFNFGSTKRKKRPSDDSSSKRENDGLPF